jgi:hypothetical protein
MMLEQETLFEGQGQTAPHKPEIAPSPLMVSLLVVVQQEKAVEFELHSDLQHTLSV